MKTALNALAIALTVATRLVSAQAHAADFYGSRVGCQSIIDNHGPHASNSGLYSAARRLQAAGARGGEAGARSAFFRCGRERLGAHSF
jgi:hypothetical protein